jgi:NAD(P)-dependent dehydrogenase (short-subunit alcohol dehydrogenase family)
MQKVALIMAGGSGIGAGAARQLAADGFAVGILSSSGKGEALAAELGGIGVTGTNQSNGDIGALVDQAMARWGRVDVLVNSAGHGPRGPVLGLSDEDWRAGMDVYLMNVIRPVRLVAPIMGRQGGGAIINVGSYVSVEPDAAFPMSSVFRAGVSAFSKLVADEYAGQGVRVNTVACGFFDSLPEKAEWRAKVPMGRYGTVDEVSKVIGFLASDGAGYVTGQTIRVDGGITRSV